MLVCKRRRKLVDAVRDMLTMASRGPAQVWAYKTGGMVGHRVVMKKTSGARRGVGLEDGRRTRRRPDSPGLRAFETEEIYAIATSTTAEVT